jgi:hypothetical protein
LNLDDSIPDGMGASPSSSLPYNKRQDLYHELLMKVHWDQLAADRLIELERKKTPTADRTEWIKRAIEHWNRDNL